jgi:hypothetical protein
MRRPGGNPKWKFIYLPQMFSELDLLKYQNNSEKIFRSAAVFVTAVLMLSGGCQEQSGFKPGPNLTTPLDSPVGMVKYLKNLPAVKKVENWENEYGQGVTITTKNYIIHTTLLDPLMLRQVPAFMESAHRAYQQQLPELIQTRTKFTVYLFGDREQWEQFTKEFTGRQWALYQQIQKGAYCLNGTCVAYNIGRRTTFSVLAHEGWHQFNSKHFAYRLPSWLDEGIAMMFEVSRYEKGSFTFHPEQNLGRLGPLRKAMLSKKTIPLKDIIVLNPGQVVSDTDAISAFYAQSYALVRFLREEGYGKRLKKFHNLMLGALRGNWPLDPRLRRIAADRNIPITADFNRFVSTKLFAMYIEEDMDAIEREYQAFCQKITYRVRLN